MRYFQLSLLIIVACLLFATPLALAGCGGGLSDEQRENYLQMAKEYEVKATEHQRLADKFWGISLEIRPSSQYNIELKKSVEAQAKRHDDMAKEYRQQALHYRTLAAQ